MAAAKRKLAAGDVCAWLRQRQPGIVVLKEVYLAFGLASGQEGRSEDALNSAMRTISAIAPEWLEKLAGRDDYMWHGTAGTDPAADEVALVIRDGQVHVVQMPSA